MRARLRRFSREQKYKFFETTNPVRRGFNKESSWRLARELDAWLLGSGAKLHMTVASVAKDKEWRPFEYDIETTWGAAYVSYHDSWVGAPWLHVRFDKPWEAAKVLNGVSEFGEPNWGGPVNSYSGKYNCHPSHTGWFRMLNVFQYHLQRAGFGKE